MHLRDIPVDSARYMHKDSTRHSTVRGPNKSFRSDLAIIMGDEREEIALSLAHPRRLALEQQVLERDVAIPRHRRLPRRVEPLDAPFRELVAEEVDKVLLRHDLARRPGDPRNEDRGQQLAVVNVEVVATRRHELEKMV